MAIFKTALAAVLLLAIVINLSHQSDPAVIKDVVNSPLPMEMDCDGACDARCQLSSRPHLCKRACGTCCARCDCVPPGTAGNYDACPCYANMTTHGGRHKCP